MINTVLEIDKKDIYTKKKVDAKKQSKQGDSHAIDYYSKYTKFSVQELGNPERITRDYYTWKMTEGINSKGQLSVSLFAFLMLNNYSLNRPVLHSTDFQNI